MTARPKQRYRIAAIGAGRMGIGHVEAVVKCPRWELVYVCDLLDERLQLARHHAPHAHLTKKVEEILDDESVDAVTVNTLSDVRPSIVRKAIAAGKHVLCEKPLAPTPAEAKQLVEDIRGTDRLISVNLFNRNHAFLHRAKRFIQEGQIGELAIIRLNHCTSLYGPSAPSAHELVEGYVLHDCGMHYVDVARWFAESEYMEFDARVVRFWGLEYRLYFMVQGSFENGVLFDLNNSHCYGALAKQKRNNLSFEFIGSRGVITLAHT
jgi:predicted dehydrogenase